MRYSLYEVKLPQPEYSALATNLLIVLREHNLTSYMHSVNTSILMYLYAKDTGKTEEEAVQYYTTGLFHDIGKVCITNTILNYDGPLTKYDKEIVQLHAKYGALLIKEEFDEEIVNAIRDHHIQYNRLKPKSELTSAIHAIDVYDALCSPRPYHPGTDPLVVVDTLKQDANTKYDPNVISHISTYLCKYTYCVYKVL